MQRDNLKNTLEARWGVAFLVIGMVIYAGLLGRAIYLEYEPRIWGDLLLRDAWIPDAPVALLIILEWIAFNLCSLFISSVVIFCLLAKTLASPHTSHLKLALVAAVLVIAAFTGWFLVQGSFDSEVGEFESTNIGPSLVATDAFYVASLLGLRGMLPAIIAVFGTRLTFFRRVFILMVVLTLLSGLFWSLIGSISAISLYACNNHSLGP